MAGPKVNLQLQGFSQLSQILEISLWQNNVKSPGGYWSKSHPRTARGGFFFWGVGKQLNKQHQQLPRYVIVPVCWFFFTKSKLLWVGKAFISDIFDNATITFGQLLHCLTALTFRPAVRLYNEMVNHHMAPSPVTSFSNKKGRNR